MSFTFFMLGFVAGYAIGMFVAYQINKHIRRKFHG